VSALLGKDHDVASGEESGGKLAWPRRMRGFDVLIDTITQPLDRTLGR
jgi:hypothetical protein